MTGVYEVNKVYPAFIDDELKTERERRASLDARGGAIITQCGALSALLIGVAGFALRRSGEASLSGYERGTLIVSAVLFVLACVAAILVTVPFMYNPHPVGAESTYDHMASDKRLDSEGDALTAVATLRKGTLVKLREGNNVKVNFVFVAQILQIAALAALLSGVVFAILSR